MRQFLYNIKTLHILLVLLLASGCLSATDSVPPGTLQAGTLPTGTLPAGTQLPAGSSNPGAAPEPSPAASMPETPTQPEFANPPATTAVTAAPPTPPPLKMDAPRNVIFMVVDSLRADHIASFGYPRATTPNLDALVAASGVSFRNAVPSSSWTCPANASLFSGKMPGVLNATFQTMGSTLPQNVTSIAEYLDAAGFLTAGFVNNECLSSSFGFSQGFDNYDDSFARRPHVSTSSKVRAEEMNAAVMDWIDSLYFNLPGEKPPLFLFIYYMEPHVWFNPPAPYNTLFDPGDPSLNLADLFVINETTYNSDPLTSRQREIKLALYDGEIAYWDAQLAIFLDYLEQNNLREDTLLIITSDHGELLGEYGRWNHANGLEHELLHSPIVMSYPGAIPPGLAVQAPVQTMDILPTVLDWLGISIPAEIQGQSIRPQAQGLSGNAGRPVFSEINGVKDPGHWAYWLAPRENLYSVYQDGWRYIHHSEQLAPDELYHINTGSPFQGENLAAAETGRAAKMRTLIINFFHLSP